jgi:hypothetical protein
MKRGSGPVIAIGFVFGSFRGRLKPEAEVSCAGWDPAEGASSTEHHVRDGGTLPLWRWMRWTPAP